MVLGFIEWALQFDPDKYSYFDTPDGQDCFRKIYFASKHAAVAGLALSTWDVLLYSHPTGYAQAAFRFGYWTGPIVAMAAAYSASTCISTNLREKDDHWNHCVGGIVAGSIWGATRGSFASGGRTAILWAGIGMALKFEDTYKYGIFTYKGPNEKGGIRKHDWTLYKDSNEPIRSRT